MKKQTHQLCECEQPEFFNSIIWRSITLPYKSKGYHSAQIPKDSSWLDSSGNFAYQRVPFQTQLVPFQSQLHVLARDKSGDSIVTNYVTPSFSSLYISHMPEYSPSKQCPQDAQFLYNCLLFLAMQSFTRSLRELCISQIVSMLPAIKQEEILKLPRDIQDRLNTVLKHDPLMVSLLSKKQGLKRPSPSKTHEIDQEEKENKTTEQDT